MSFLKGGIPLPKYSMREGISAHIKSNMGLYFLVFVFLSLGIASGAFTVRALDDVQRQALIKYMQGFFQILTTNSVDSIAVLKQSIINNVQTIAVIWILGITIIGIPISLFIIGVRGFILGFTVGFLLNGLGWQGLFFTALAILPQNLIIIPCLAAVEVTSLSFSLMIIHNRRAKKWTNNYYHKFLSYTVIILILFAFSICGSLIEAYIVPVFIKLMSSYLTL